MKRWALVKNNVVLNVVEQESAPELEGTWVECPAAGPGWSYNSGTFTRPVESFGPFMSKLAYWARWPEAKRQAFKLAAKSNIEFEDFLDMIGESKYIDPKWPKLVDAHARIVAAGGLTVEENFAILNPVIQLEEAP